MDPSQRDDPYTLEAEVGENKALPDTWKARVGDFSEPEFEYGEDYDF